MPLSRTKPPSRLRSWHADDVLTHDRVFGTGEAGPAPVGPRRRRRIADRDEILRRLRQRERERQGKNTGPWPFRPA